MNDNINGARPRASASPPGIPPSVRLKTWQLANGATRHSEEVFAEAVDTSPEALQDAGTLAYQVVTALAAQLDHYFAARRRRPRAVS